MMKDPRVAQIAAREERIGIAREIVGAKAWPFRATLLDKSSSSNWLVAWHQDTALSLRERQELPRWGKTMVRCGCCAHQSGVLIDEEVLRLAEKISGVECLVAQGGSLS
jgi:hypothetical protein